jgi:16S rRNA (uracil1498-N3)-methyltransferase
MNVFFASEIKNKIALLSSEESTHCIRVLRLNKGDKVQIIDGKGGFFSGSILVPDAKQCKIQLLEEIVHQKYKNYSIHIAIAPTKSIARFEWFVEKAVEIGIDVITPLLCHRSERKTIRTERFHKLVISSMKQALVPYLPKFNELTSFNKLITNITATAYNRFIANCDKTEKRSLKDVLAPQSNVIILIGPEGDFTAAEIELAISHGFIPVNLGNNRLRTETAGIIACHTINLLNDLKSNEVNK